MEKKWLKKFKSLLKEKEIVLHEGRVVVDGDFVMDLEMPQIDGVDGYTLSLADHQLKITPFMVDHKRTMQMVMLDNVVTIQNMELFFVAEKQLPSEGKKEVKKFFSSLGFNNIEIVDPEEEE